MPKYNIHLDPEFRAGGGVAVQVIGSEGLGLFKNIERTLNTEGV
jgi:hypothetical protein